MLRSAWGLTEQSFFYTIHTSIPTGTTLHPIMAKRIRTKAFEKPKTIQKVQRSIETLVKRYLDENGSWEGEMSSTAIRELASNSIGRLEPRKFNEQFFRGIGAGSLWEWFTELVVSCGHRSLEKRFSGLNLVPPAVSAVGHVSSLIARSAIFAQRIVPTSHRNGKQQVQTFLQGRKS